MDADDVQEAHRGLEAAVHVGRGEEPQQGAEAAEEHGPEGEVDLTLTSSSMYICSEGGYRLRRLEVEHVDLIPRSKYI